MLQEKLKNMQSDESDLILVIPICFGRIQSVLDPFLCLFWTGSKHFGLVQIMLWTDKNKLDSSKTNWTDQNKLDPSKTNWTDQNKLDPSKTDWTDQNRFGPK